MTGSEKNYIFTVTIFNFTGNHCKRTQIRCPLDKLTDETIMLKVKDGNLAEMSHLFERYHLRIFNFFLRMGLTADISQDLTQNLFYRMIKYRNSFRSDSVVKSWIYQIARNIHKDYRNQQKRSGEIIEIVERYPSDTFDENGSYGEEDYQRLEKSLALLSDEQREIIVLSRYQGLKYEEISTIVSLSVPAIKVTVHRAMKQLRCIYMNQE